jgi:DNA-binding transcriptional LysR family regulator
MSFGTRHLSTATADFAHRHPDLEILIDYDDRIIDLARSDPHRTIARVRPIARKFCEDPTRRLREPGLRRPPRRPGRPCRLGRASCIGYLKKGGVTGLPMQGRIVANNGEAMRDMAIAGLGVTLVPLFIAHDALADGRLVRLVEHLTPVPLPISAVWPPVKPMPTKVRAIIDHLANAFGTAPPWQVGQ